MKCHFNITKYICLTFLFFSKSETTIIFFSYMIIYHSKFILLKVCQGGKIKYVFYNFVTKRTSRKVKKMNLNF